MKISRLLLLLSIVLLFAGAGWAGPVTALWDWSVAVNGTEYNPPAPPSTVNMSAFDTSTGIGTIVFTFPTAGAYRAGVYFDIDIDEGFGDSFNEFGTVSGLAGSLSWMLAPPLDLWPAFSTDTLDNTNHVATYSPPPTACCDVGMAMIAGITVPSGFRGIVTFNVGFTAPTGFYLQQTDHDLVGATSGASVFLNTTSELVPTGELVIPEPLTLTLIGAGLAALGIYHRKSSR